MVVYLRGLSDEEPCVPDPFGFDFIGEAAASRRSERATQL